MNKFARLIVLFCATVSTVRFGPQATPKADAPNVTPTSGVTRSSFGTVSGQNVEIFTLRNAHGIEVKATSYGAIITSIVTPDRNGRPGDIVLGFDTIEGYLKDSPYFGAVVGRYGNRIAKGRFTLDGHTYTLATNNGPNHLHGGLKGFDKVVWKAEPLQGKTGVAFSRRSPDGEEGYPGNLDVRDHLRADRPQRARHRLSRDVRQGDAGQPDAALLLQSGGRGRHPRPSADDCGRPIHAGGHYADPHGRSRAGRGHAVRLPHGDRDRRAHRPGRTSSSRTAAATITTGC